MCEGNTRKEKWSKCMSKICGWMKVNNYGEEGGGGEERDREWINDLIQSNAKNNWEGWTGVKRGGAVVGDVRWGEGS